MAHDVVVNRSMGFRVAIDYCRRNGAFVRPRVGTDEMVVSHPRIHAGMPCRVKGTRKDCPRALMVFCRKLETLNAGLDTTPAVGVASSL